jgi:hypothetical protein
MNTTLTFVAALVGLSIAGLVAWAWIAIVQVESELRPFCGFDGMHFEA